MPKTNKKVSTKKDSTPSSTISSSLSSFSTLNERYKKNAKFLMVNKVEKLPVISSGSWIFDSISSVGGFPQGLMVELHGKESSGKTTLAVSGAVAAQKMGIHVLYLDFEQAVNSEYLATLGLDFNTGLLSLFQPESLEEGVEIAFDYLKQGEPLFIVLDSVPAMTPADFLNNPDAWKKDMGMAAKMQSKFVDVMSKKIKRTGSYMVNLNQMRANIVKGGGNPFAQKTTKAAGGWVAKHCHAGIFNMVPTGKEKQGTVEDKVQGNIVVPNVMQVKIANIKNKMGMPFKEGTMHIRLGERIDNARTLIEAAEARKLLTKKTGGWYSSKLTDAIHIQGAHKLSDFFRDNVDITGLFLKELGWIREDGVLDLSADTAVITRNPKNNPEEED
jgi:protein RecA